MFTLYYYHDPMCSWCWGYRPTAQALFSSLPQHISVKNVLGGLAPDSDEPMAAELLSAIPGHWKRIHEMLGTEFNFTFWTNCKPRRSTYPACRAVIAASYQGREEEMIFAIQRAYYLRAMNPSDLETLEALAGELDLDRALFEFDLRSTETELEFQRQLDFTHRSPIRGFPALALDDGRQLRPVPLDYKSHESTLKHLLAMIDNMQTNSSQAGM